MQSDVNTLEESYAKYKDKTGKKAQNLADTIKCWKNFAELVNRTLSKKK